MHWNADILTQLTLWTFQLVVAGLKKYEDDEDEDDEEVGLSLRVAADFFDSPLLDDFCKLLKGDSWQTEVINLALENDFRVTPWFTFVFFPGVGLTLYL